MDIRKIKITLIVSLIVFLTILGFRGYNLEKTSLYLKHFTPIPDLDTFVEAAPVVFGGAAKVPHAVLILHGYSGCCQNFGTLLHELEAAEIPFYAPNLTGFGLADMHLLTVIKASDWLRDAINAYDVLAAFANEVSVVGHSNGGVLAIYVSEQRPVKHLVLTAPNIAPAKGDRYIKTLLGTPGIGHMMQWTIPVFHKPSRFSKKIPPTRPSIKPFCYPALPTQSLLAVWKIQDTVDLSKIRAETVDVFYGEKDKVVDMKGALKRFEKQKVAHRKHSFATSGHNILQDSSKKEVAEAIINILKTDLPK